MANAVLADRTTERGERSDHQLVTAVRAGDDRAFEQLYTRYQRRIAAYVYGMVKDHGRAEDITQEVFVSALRRIRNTERPIAFKPWIYEIAKNACIDAYRRGRRAQEVSFDADDRLSPSDHGRLVATSPGPDDAYDTKLELDNLCGAFGGLSESHHEILVMRELEGLSYKDIGDRMGMSRPAVESTLFRARKRLGEEYDELATGARCLKVQGIIAEGGKLGRRDGQKLARHVSHCQPCRRLAAAAGVAVPVPARRRFAEKIAGLLPIPGFLRFRRGGGGDDVTATALGGHGGSAWVAHAPAFADAMHSGWSKGAAGLAALALAGGVGAGAIGVGSEKRDERGTGYRATELVTPAEREDAEAKRLAAAAGSNTQERSSASTRDRSDGRRTDTARRRGTAGRSRRAGSDATRPGASGGTQTQAPAQGSAPAVGDGGTGASARSGDGTRAGGGTAPAAEAPPTIETPPPVDVQNQVPSVQETTNQVTEALPGVNETVQTVAPGAPQLPEVNEVTDPVTETVDEVVGGLLRPTP